MNINIFRRRFTPWSVDGTMIVGGSIFCDTLEHPEHYLPAGRYKISLVPVRKKKLWAKKLRNKDARNCGLLIKPVIQPRVVEVPDFVGRRPCFMPGNGPLRLRYGSIILGHSRYTGIVTKSEKFYNKFFKLMVENPKHIRTINLYIRDWGVDEIPLKYLLIFQ